MNYAIELYFDDTSSNQIENFRQNLKTKGVTIDSGTLPHISLAIYLEPNIEQLTKSIIDFAKQEFELSLDLSSIGIFPGEESVIFLSPKVTPKLLNIHHEFLNHMQQFSVNLSLYYSELNWTPHCTMGIHLSPDQLLLAVDALNGLLETPIKASVKSIGILAFPPNNQILRTDFSRAN
jgi:2'-5' RNA ligase